MNYKNFVLQPDTEIDDLAYKVGSLAIQAMIYEVSCFPSPGLVSPVSNGAHKDMNYYTFIDSTCALIKYFKGFVQLGLEGYSNVELFAKIRELGVRAEEDMFIKTKGVNTHKGMLFLLGISCAAVGQVINNRRGFEEISNVIRKMTVGLVERELIRLDKKENLSHGEKLYLNYKVYGVRGEAERGIPTVFNHALKLYEDSVDLNTNDRLIHTLIGIMQVCEDTNIMHRHSPETLLEVQTKAKAIINSGGIRSEKGRAMIQALNHEFIERNISPGGSADLLGITVFLSLVRDKIF